MSGKPIVINTDCSGMEAPIQALRNLPLKVVHRFSCDIDKNARATILANFPPKEELYEDVMQRDNTSAPGCDVYVAGFPCQPFSVAGLGQGFKDKKGRGKIFFFNREYIEKQQPKVFILENVSGLVKKNKGTYFAAILKSLEMLGTYNVCHRILNTKEHGIPQNRKRIYIIGIRRDVDNGSFEFPEGIACPDIERLLEPRRQAAALSGLPPLSQGTAHQNVLATITKLMQRGSNPHKTAYIVDVDSSAKRSKYMKGVSPCITCSRRQGHWVTNRGRRFSKAEMMRLHGMDPTKFKVAVSQPQLGKQLGNTMSVNVLERVFVRLLPAAGLARRGRLVDRWENGSAVKALERTVGRGFAAISEAEMASAAAAAAEGAERGLKRRAASAGRAAAAKAKARRKA